MSGKHPRRIRGRILARKNLERINRASSCSHGPDLFSCAPHGTVRRAPPPASPSEPIFKATDVNAFSADGACRAGGAGGGKMSSAS